MRGQGWRYVLLVHMHPQKNEISVIWINFHHIYGTPHSKFMHPPNASQLTITNFKSCIIGTSTLMLSNRQTYTLPYNFKLISYKTSTISCLLSWFVIIIQYSNFCMDKFNQTRIMVKKWWIPQFRETVTLFYVLRMIKNPMRPFMCSHILDIIDRIFWITEQLFLGIIR